MEGAPDAFGQTLGDWTTRKYMYAAKNPINFSCRSATANGNISIKNYPLGNFLVDVQHVNEAAGESL
jgi:hypothetical protein